MPKTRFLACYWMLGADPEKSEEWKTAVGAHFVATSLKEAVAVCVREATLPQEGARPEDTAAASMAI